MKSIYTIIDGKVFRVRQKTIMPTEMAIKPRGASLTKEFDSGERTATLFINVNSLGETDILESNKEVYEKMVRQLKRQKTTEIFDIYNKFKIYIDYAVMEGDREIEHAALIRPIEAEDMIYPLGVATNNESVYRRVKNFNQAIEFCMKNRMPHGIIDRNPRNYTICIHNIAIFQDLYNIDDEHESIYEMPHNLNSGTVNSCLENMVMVYSTYEKHIKFPVSEVNFQPRKLSIRVNVTLNNYIEVYNKDTITQILQDNMSSKYPEEEGGCNCGCGDKDEEIVVPGENDDEKPGCGCQFPKDDDKPVGDGKYEPDSDGYFTYYERCTSTTPNALLVVENEIPEESYNTSTMIRKYMVIKDITDVKVGDYVILRESLNYV